jgi:N-acetylglucosamine kinase-like BadF-type ATPase
VLGDEGSGYWIGRNALRAVVRHADGRGGPTSLTPRLLAHFGLAGSTELIHRVYHKALAPSDVGALAGYVQQARDEGDEVAAGILNYAADELLTTAAAVTKRLEMESESFSCVLAGGMFRAVPWLCDRMKRLLPSVAPHSRAILLEEEPALGAVQLALALAQGRARIPAYRPNLA